MKEARKNRGRKRRRERRSVARHGGSSAGTVLARVTGYAGGVITMIPSPGSVIISSPRHPRPKNRGTHGVLNPVAHQQLQPGIDKQRDGGWKRGWGGMEFMDLSIIW